MTPELVSLLNTYPVPAGICDSLGNWMALGNKLQAATETLRLAAREGGRGFAMTSAEAQRETIDS